MNTYIIDKFRLGCVRIQILEQSNRRTYTNDSISIRASFKLEKVLAGDYLKEIEGQIRYNTRLSLNWIFEFETDEDALLYFEVMDE